MGRAQAFILQHPEQAERIVVRAIEDALNAAEPIYWRRRARTLGEVGTPWADAAAVACVRHALFLEAQRRGVDLVEVMA